MFHVNSILRSLAAALVLFAVVGCADQAAQPKTSSAPTSGGPELVGAWYQVFFDSNMSDIDARGQTVVKNVAYVVKNNDTTRVTVIGKTDRVGSAPANMALSQRRADKVRDALVSAGVPLSHIDTRWTGETKQNVSTNDDMDEQRNRAVDITVIKQPPHKK
ncbi:MAG: OmpA family protein [Alphaproteobacteria bacterium]|nr:OmpA family protein [Alphaproteobacteria bacterium]